MWVPEMVAASKRGAGQFRQIDESSPFERAFFTISSSGSFGAFLCFHPNLFRGPNGLSCVVESNWLCRLHGPIWRFGFAFGRGLIVRGLLGQLKGIQMLPGVSPLDL